MDLGPQDDFKWFGEGFDGFPKRLPDDVVEYLIFIIDSKLGDTQVRERLQAFQRALVVLEKKFLKEYIWQRESIKLDLIREGSHWLLKGSTNYGDSVADEWLIVFLLRELSKKFPDAWIRVYDTDGEFLLIEAADALPAWLSPEVAENRVWIQKHQLLVIPLSKTETPKPLDREEALAIIEQTPTRMQHLPKVETEAFHRLKGYPAAISENQHHATLPLPRRVAHVLHTKPSHVAAAVEAFYLRDPVSLRLLQPEKSDVALKFPPTDFVEVSVRFTKVLYAQLLGQRWTPPGPYGDALAGLIKNGGKATSRSREKCEIGVKLAAGFEMLVQHKLYANKKNARELQLLLDDLEAGEEILPIDAEIAQWPKLEDDESWLNIDFAEFERELAGKGGAMGAEGGFGDKNAQENLRKMVDRFNKFLEDDSTGNDRAGSLDPMDMDNDSDAERRAWDDPEDSDETDEEADDEQADAEYAEYEKAYETYMSLSSAEKSVLLDEARELANAEEADKEEDDEIQKLTEMMEAELFSHGALKLNPESDKKSDATKNPKLDKGKGKARLDKVDEEDHADEDDDEEEYLDEDYNLADNMLKAFKGQAGLAGPAGNLMGMMGVQFPPDADDEEKPRKGKS
ncbi:SGT1-domain-containing protein [Polyplosphaeria fusca]|uniref:SGT1-domain-containing protein n=1 Tax=Polyplosphaeria fusca TaxID=682080 RepID=A0A9P4R0S5_9PLEO|nr:SGT1-domain-containing protein [Polyplosphaeria fusca]